MHLVALSTWIPMGVTVAVAILLPGLADRAVVQWAPWLAGLLLLGMPHGSYDHRAGAWLSDRDGKRPMIRFVAIYLCLALLVLLIWLHSARATLVGFLIVAAFHFGEADVAWSALAGLDRWSRSAGYRLVLLATRSYLPIALPVLLHLDRLDPGSVARLINASELEPAVIPGWIKNWGLAIAGLLVGIQITWSVVLCIGAGRRVIRSAASEICETILLVVFFAAVPPILALGIYFNAWHSLRHIFRLMRLDDRMRGLLHEGHGLAAAGTFLLRASPMTMGAVLLMAVVGLVLRAGLTSPAELGLLAVLLLSMLTLPHTAIVCWMDWRQQIWSSRPGRHVLET